MVLPLAGAVDKETGGKRPPGFRVDIIDDPRAVFGNVVADRLKLTPIPFGPDQPHDAPDQAGSLPERQFCERR